MEKRHGLKATLRRARDGSYLFLDIKVVPAEEGSFVEVILEKNTSQIVLIARVLDKLDLTGIP